MQIAILNIGLLVFLFGVLASARSDDRLRCWQAGWICVLLHYLAEIWNPASILGAKIQFSVSSESLFLASLLFVISSTVLWEGRKAAFRLAVAVASSTLICMNAAIAAPRATGILAALVIARLSVVTVFAARKRPHRRIISSLLSIVCLGIGAGILFGLFIGHSEFVIYGMLCEFFLVAAIEFWTNHWEWTIGLNTIGVGLVAWASVFPLSLVVRHLWPHLSIEPEIWNAPALAISIGMILVVLEEDTRAAQELTREYRLLFDANPHPLWVFDNPTLQILDANQAALVLHGYTREEFLRMNLRDILDPGLIDEVRAETLDPKPTTKRLARHICKDGRMLPLEVNAHLIDFRGKSCRFVLGTDLTEREELTQKLEYQARHDALTGLPNRLLFEQQLSAQVERTVKSGGMLATFCVDLVRLKALNDTYGVRVGDECLKRAAEILKQHLPGSDVLFARTSGDEFGAALGSVDSMAVLERIADELRAAFSQPLFIEGYKVQLAVSMGVAVCPQDGSDSTTLWRRAENAQRLSRAENDGLTMWYSTGLNRRAEEDSELEAFMQVQLERGGFHLVYQPIYAFDGTMRGLEALLRLDHPKYGAVSPARFIPIAERTGLIVPLGQWVLEDVCRQLNLWRQAGIPLTPVAVNASGLQLMRVQFAGQVMETLARFDIDPHWIHLEVTETAAMRNVEAVAERMAALSVLGIRFSIDDFGTGHSSLGRLHQLPISLLKIDRSFVSQLCGRNGAFSIVEAVISMAHALNLQVVAEGVETRDELSCLKTLHCDLLQGYLLSRPVAPDAIPALVSSTHPVLLESASEVPVDGTKLGRS